MTEQLKSGLGLEIGDEVRVVSSDGALGQCWCRNPHPVAKYPERCEWCKMRIPQVPQQTGEVISSEERGYFLGLYPHFKSAELVLVEMHHDGGTYVFRHSDVRRVDDRAA